MAVIITFFRGTSTRNEINHAEWLMIENVLNSEVFDRSALNSAIYIDFTRLILRDGRFLLELFKGPHFASL